MRSGGKDFNYFKLTTLANFVQFRRMRRPPMFCLEDWGKAWAPWASIGYATAAN